MRLSLVTPRRYFRKTTFLGAFPRTTRGIGLAATASGRAAGGTMPTRVAVTTGTGQADLAKLEILGPALNEHIKPYKLNDNIEPQLIWMKPVPS